MREYSTPTATGADHARDAARNLTDDVVRWAAQEPGRVLFRVPGTDPGGWHDVTAAQFHGDVKDVAKGLVAAGVEVGERVGLLCRTRYEWTLLDYAIWYAGAVTVPAYDTAPVAQLESVLAGAGVRTLVVETAEHASRVAGLRERLEDLHHVWAIDGGAVDVLTRLGGDVGEEEIEERRRAPGPEDLATLLYTSGTTGEPKGCRLTHGNLLAEVAAATHGLAELFDPDEAHGPASTLLFLPLAHVFARVVQVGCVHRGVALGHTPGVSRLEQDLRTFAPSFVLTVPRVFEMLFNTASQTAVADGRGRVFDRAVDTAIAWSRAEEQGRAGWALRLRHAALDRVVYRDLRALLGGRCRYAVSGGAPLGDRLGHFYRGIGVPVLEGYGLSESSAALTLNVPGAAKTGTVGRPLPGTSVRVAEDSELLFRGPTVFPGYWDDDPATADVLDAEGWLHSGDVGEIDDEGFVRVTGRKREILVTAGGKHVSPVVLEDLLRAHPLVDQCLVVGDGQPFVGALVTLDEETLPAWCRAHGKPSRVADLLEDPDLLAALQQGVDTANRAVSRAEQIRRFLVVPYRWSEEDGQLTPSLKLKRSVVLREAREDVAALYRG